MAERDPASGPSSMYLKFKKGVNRSRPLGYFSVSARIGSISVPLGSGVREPNAQEAVRFGVARRKRFRTRLGPLQQISRLFEHPGTSEFRRGGFTERSGNSAPNAASSLCTCRVIAEGVQKDDRLRRRWDPGGELYEGA